MSKRDDKGSGEACWWCAKPGVKRVETTPGTVILFCRQCAREYLTRGLVTGGSTFAGQKPSDWSRSSRRRGGKWS